MYTDVEQMVILVHSYSSSNVVWNTFNQVTLHYNQSAVKPKNTPDRQILYHIVEIIAADYSDNSNKVMVHCCWHPLHKGLNYGFGISRNSEMQLIPHSRVFHVNQCTTLQWVYCMKTWCYPLNWKYMTYWQRKPKATGNIHIQGGPKNHPTTAHLNSLY